MIKLVKSECSEGDGVSEKKFKAMASLDSLKEMAEFSVRMTRVFMLETLNQVSQSRFQASGSGDFIQGYFESDTGILKRFIEPEFLKVAAQTNGVETISLFHDLIRKSPEWMVDDIITAFSDAELWALMNIEEDDEWHLDCCFTGLLKHTKPEDYEGVLSVIKHAYPSPFSRKSFVKELADISFNKAAEMNLQEEQSGGYICDSFAVAAVFSKDKKRVLGHVWFMNAMVDGGRQVRGVKTSDAICEKTASEIYMPLGHAFKQRRVVPI